MRFTNYCKAVLTNPTHILQCISVLEFCKYFGYPSTAFLVLMLNLRHLEPKVFMYKLLFLEQPCRKTLTLTWTLEQRAKFERAVQYDSEFGEGNTFQSLVSLEILFKT